MGKEKREITEEGLQRGEIIEGGISEEGKVRGGLERKGIRDKGIVVVRFIDGRIIHREGVLGR